MYHPTYDFKIRKVSRREKRTVKLMRLKMDLKGALLEVTGRLCGWA